MNKKQLAIIGLIISVLGAWAGYNQWRLGIQTNQASVDFSFVNAREVFYAGSNLILLDCRNGGDMDGDFNLVVTFTNASFSNQTEQPYLRVNDTIVKFGFVLPKGVSGSKWVYFSVSENVDGFSLALALEKVGANPLKPNATYPTYLRYVWSSAYLGRGYSLVDSR
jgi:hypothetical protein